MLVKDLVIDGLASYEVIYFGKRYKFAVKIKSYQNGKAMVLAFLESRGILKQLSVRITELHPLADEAQEKLKSIDWESLEVWPLSRCNRIDLLLKQCHMVN